MAKRINLESNMHQILEELKKIAPSVAFKVEYTPDPYFRWDIRLRRRVGSRPQLDHVKKKPVKSLESLLNREQWILGRQMAAAVSCLNAPFCDGGPAKKQDWLLQVAAAIARDCGGIMALEDAVIVLENAIRLHPSNTNPYNELIDHPLRESIKL